MARDRVAWTTLGTCLIRAALALLLLIRRIEQHAEPPDQSGIKLNGDRRDLTYSWNNSRSRYWHLLGRLVL
ncbi:hypothetical protein KCU89_g6, partial [Aureobasidium melanogenum]